MIDDMSTELETRVGAAPPAFETSDQEAVFWRGAFIHHYSLVEFNVSELILRSLNHDEYRHLGTLPGKWPKRISRLSDILSCSGPLRQFADSLRALLRPISLVENDRHLFVHGRMIVEIGKEEPLVSFEYHDAWNEQMESISLPMSHFRYLAQELGYAAVKLHELTAEIFFIAGLSAVDLEAPEPRQRTFRNL